LIAVDTAARTFGAGVLLSAFLFGFRHGIDWDHIAAITDITSTQETRGASMFFGTLYALGHALVVFVIGSLAILLGQRLPPGIDHVMERIVGFTLIVLGVYVMVGLVRHGREFRMRSRWMLIFSGVRNAYRRMRPTRTGAVDEHQMQPVHVHALEGDDIPLPVAGDIAVSEWHHGHHGHPGHHHHKHPQPDDEAFMNYGRATAFVVGMVHGIGAETPTQILIFLAVAGAGSKLAGEIVLGAFLVGLLTSNSLITFGSSIGYLRASENWRVYATVAVMTATFSLVIGSLFLIGRGNLLPAIFGG
jgi:cytochrome c biogenesis protein CcdA